MLSVDEIRGVLDRLDYRPGWTFDVWAADFEGIHLAVNAPVLDACTLVETELHVVSPMPPMVDEAELLRWLVWRLERIESHECREWLRWRNERRPVFDPHGPGR